MTKETEPLDSTSLQKMLGQFVKLPSRQQMKYWDENYKLIPSGVRNDHMNTAHRNLWELMKLPGSKEKYDNLPVDIQSCLPIYIAASEDLAYIEMETEPEYEMTA